MVWPTLADSRPRTETRSSDTSNGIYTNNSYVYSWAFFATKHFEALVSYSQFVLGIASIPTAIHSYVVRYIYFDEAEKIPAM